MARSKPMKIQCHLYAHIPHGSHRYFRGDQRVVCMGKPKKAF